MSEVGKIEGAGLTFLATQLQRPEIKAEVLSFVDTGIATVDAQLKDAIDKGLSSKGGLLGAGLKSVEGPINTAIDTAVAAGETDLGNLYDEVPKAMLSEAAKLEA